MSKQRVATAAAELFARLREGDLDTALALAVAFAHPLTPKGSASAPAVAALRSTVYPLAEALREAGRSELAARYVQRYNLHLCPVCADTPASPCAPSCGETLPLHVLVADLCSAGDYDAVLRLSADARLARPPHSLEAHFPPAELLAQCLAEPRFVFEAGKQTTAPLDLGAHVPLLKRWVAQEVAASGLGQGARSPLLGLAVGALLSQQIGGADAAAAAACNLQLSAVSPATTRLSLPREHCVPALLGQLGRSDPGAALELFRKWYPRDVDERGRPLARAASWSRGDSRAAEGAKRQCPASGGWDDPEEFGVAPAPLIEQQLRR